MLNENDELILRKMKDVMLMTRWLKELGVQVNFLEEDDNMSVYCGSMLKITVSVTVPYRQ